MTESLVVCDVDKDLVKKLRDFRFRKETNNAAIVMKIDKDKQLVILDEEHEHREHLSSTVTSTNTLTDACLILSASSSPVQWRDKHALKKKKKKKKTPTNVKSVAQLLLHHPPVEPRTSRQNRTWGRGRERKNGVHIRGLLLYACSAAHGGAYLLRYLARKYTRVDNCRPETVGL
ncbi:hypothetical protein F2P81_003096 [Scophthalmus maximus]|uniref:Uncharacterized protein n=1 Tax=Scophthalmus maximus TaxID=52904 RepID=A0A6A4THI8_SCOMX|nr:hypothetical protein F2P81_003096 [Scophthalmus maximus]